MKIFQKILKMLAKSVSKTGFSQFRQVFEGASGKQTSKSASTSNFAQDTPMLKSARPKIVKKWLVPGLCQPYCHVWRLVRASNPGHIALFDGGVMSIPSTNIKR